MDIETVPASYPPSGTNIRDNRLLYNGPEPVRKFPEPVLQPVLPPYLRGYLPLLKGLYAFRKALRRLYRIPGDPLEGAVAFWVTGLMKFCLPHSIY